jgi:hypothetical protein
LLFELIVFSPIRMEDNSKFVMVSLSIFITDSLDSLQTVYLYCSSTILSYRCIVDVVKNFLWGGTIINFSIFCIFLFNRLVHKIQQDVTCKSTTRNNTQIVAKNVKLSLLYSLTQLFMSLQSLFCFRWLIFIKYQLECFSYRLNSYSLLLNSKTILLN